MNSPSFRSILKTYGTSTNEVGPVISWFSLYTDRLALFCGATTTLAECDDDEVRNFDEGRRPPSSVDSSSPPKLVMYVICPEFTGECDRERERDLD